MIGNLWHYKKIDRQERNYCPLPALFFIMKLHPVG